MDTEDSLAPGESFGRAAGYQMAAQAIGLAMQNAVAQQQHAYILLNAITTAATQAVLESRTEDAREAIKLAQEVLAPNTIVATLASLKDLLDAVMCECGPAAKPAASPPSGDAG